MTVDEAMLYYERVMQAEKVMGPLTLDERIIILRDFGSDVTRDDFDEMLKNKHVLQIKLKDKDNGTPK